jgi:hypothetical protein
VVIDNLNIVRVLLAPSKTDSPLAIDADAVLTSAGSLQCFQPIAGRRTKFLKPRGAGKKFQLPSCRPLDCSKSTDKLVVRQTLGV